MSPFWNWYVAILTIVFTAACVWLLFWTRRGKVNDTPENAPLDHQFDGIVELNSPMPRWWLWLFYGTIVFGVVYAVLYPTLGIYGGVLGWSSTKEYNQEVSDAEKTYGPLFESFASQDITALITDKKAMEIGQRLFSNHCATCHGSDANGAKGFPNLTDNDWLYGGTPADIKNSILNGRNGVMPPMGAALGAEGLEQVYTYLVSTRGESADSKLAAEGKTKFSMFCAACHGPDAKGNTLIGAPNLTDNVWLYSGTKAGIEKTINLGRSGKMPAHKDLLGEKKVHLIAAYIYGLSNQ